MTDFINPWATMSGSMERRVRPDIGHDYFWITDALGNYGFRYKATQPFTSLEIKASLKGIKIHKDNLPDAGGQLILILTNKEDWQIFCSLCTDLVSSTAKEKNELVLSILESRLNRWQQLLKYEIGHELSLETQMGLFTELYFLNIVLSQRVGVDSAIISWCGPDFDLQDFVLENSVFEVKSYKTSKKRRVKISSLEQLYSEKERVYLATYALSISDKGLSIADMIFEIYEQIKFSKNSLKELFESKLLNYGFAPEITVTELYKFIVDKCDVYEVGRGFPRLGRDDVHSAIDSAKYSIDLSYCESFIISPESMTI